MQGRSINLRDSHIRAVLLKDLKVRFPDKKHDLILQEFGCNAARIDVAVVNGALHGFEIKSDCDTLERLDSQISEYNRIFDFMTLVSGRKLLESAKKKIPDWWGLSLAVWTSDSVSIEEIRKPKMNVSLDSSSLAEMLWKSETIKYLRQCGFKTFSAKQPVDELRSEMVRLLPQHLIASEVRSAIKRRGGSGFEWLRTQRGGSSTTESTLYRPQYRQNLDWLLSLKSPDRHR